MSKVEVSLSLSLFGLKHKKYIFQIQTKNYGLKFYGSSDSKIYKMAPTGGWSSCT